MTHLNLANVHEMKNELNKAVEHYRLAMKFIKPAELLRTNIYLGLGNGLLLTGDEEGLIYLDSGLQSAIHSDQFYMQQLGYSFYKNHYLREKKFEKAYEYLNKEYELDKEIRGKDVQKQIEVLNLKYEDEKKAKQLAVLEKEKAENKFYLFVLITTGISVLIACILIFLIMKLKIRNARSKQKELQDQLAHKSKELVSYALNFIQKNELLNELTEKVNELKGKPAEKASKGLNQLNRIINSSMRIDQDWENFKIMFEEVHQGFFIRLKEEFPNLGNSELKLCALLRLNMNLKESSRILGISSDSVKTARSRLRKKLGLNTEDNLVDFLIRFDADAKHRMTA